VNRPVNCAAESHKGRATLVDRLIPSSAVDSDRLGRATDHPGPEPKIRPL